MAKKRKIFKKAKLNKINPQTDNRKVSWLELYFDLFFVVVMYYLVHELAYDFSFANLFQYTLMFLSSLWLWFSYTYYKEIFQNHGLEIRIFTFFYMIAIASLAVFSSDVMNNNMSYYVLSYFIARLMLNIAWLHGSYLNHEFKKSGIKLSKGIILSLILLILAFFDVYNAAEIFFLLAICVDYVNPLFSIRTQSQLNLDLTRLPERFGLFLIIVMGEIVRGIINSLSLATEINIEYISISILLFALSYALWSIYFDYLPKKLSLKNMKKTFIWIYLHVILIYCLTIIGGVLLKFNIENLLIPNPILSTYLTVGVSVFMVVMGITGKLLDGKKVKKVEKKRAAIKIYTGVAVLIFGLTVLNYNMIILLSGIVFLLLAQIVYVTHLWKHNLDS